MPLSGACFTHSVTIKVIQLLLVTWDEKFATHKDCLLCPLFPSLEGRGNTQQACSLCFASMASVKEPSVIYLLLGLQSSSTARLFSLDDLQLINDSPKGRYLGPTSPEMAQTAWYSFLPPENVNSLHVSLSVLALMLRGICVG